MRIRCAGIGGEFILSLSFLILSSPLLGLKIPCDICADIQ